MRRTKWTCKACGKAAFPSEARALAAVAHIRQINTTGHVPIRAYQCEYGNGWHLTSKERRTA